jgi:hypothetical protein
LAGAGTGKPFDLAAICGEVHVADGGRGDEFEIIETLVGDIDGVDDINGVITAADRCRREISLRDDFLDEVASDGRIDERILPGGIGDGGCEELVGFVEFAVVVGIEVEIDGDAGEGRVV